MFYVLNDRVSINTSRQDGVISAPAGSVLIVRLCSHGRQSVARGSVVQVRGLGQAVTGRCAAAGQAVGLLRVGGREERGCRGGAHAPATDAAPAGAAPPAALAGPAHLRWARREEIVCFAVQL